MKILLTLALIGISTAALAESTETPRIDVRQERQAERIEKGVESGALTEKEAKRLERQQERTAKMEEKAKADGVVTKKERAHLHHRENKTSKHIKHQKHDAHYNH
jgi:hypothetical protein